MVKITRALNKNNELVTITSAKNNEKYFCEICKEELILKAVNSVKVSRYFSHKPNSICIDNWSSHDMSEWHYNWQLKFPEDCREVPLNDGIEFHRADILANGVVIEFQHSPISKDDFQKRNLFYTNCGCKVFWVFDGNTLVKEYSPLLNEYSFKRVQNQFENFNSLNGNVEIFIHYDTKLLMTTCLNANIFKSNQSTSEEDFIFTLNNWQLILNYQKQQVLQSEQIQEQKIPINTYPRQPYVDRNIALIRAYINGDINYLPQNINKRSYNRNSYRKSSRRRK